MLCSPFSDENTDSTILLLRIDDNIPRLLMPLSNGYPPFGFLSHILILD
ncbi:MAG: hypothetical protein QXP91_12715 [Candidatus Methanomethylicia archaeon]